jgi:glycosyltransferase involved in cell wall biosynthesis
MRVAMWSSTGERCGIAAYTASLSAELAALGLQVDPVAVPYEDRDPGRRSAALARLNAADVIHLQHEYSFFGGVAPGASSLAAWYRELRRPRIVTAHSVFTAAEVLRLPQETRPRQRLAKRILAALPSYRRLVERDPFAGAAAVIVHTREAAERIRRSTPGAAVTVLPAGVPTPGPPPEAETLAEFRRQHGLEGARVVTVFGYITPDKGYDTALEALRVLPPGVKLLVAGGARVEREAPFREALQAQIASLGLTGRVAITGYLAESEIPTAMAATEVALVPHRLANGSYSVMVALSYGLPVLASDLACFRDLAEADAGVELFPVGDAAALAERLGFLLASGGARRRLAAAAGAYAAGRGWAAVASQTAELYQTAAGGVP